MRLTHFFLAEQSAFLRRRSRAWRTHLRKAQAFIGQHLQEAPPDRPILILGAGSGLEIPWNLAPAHAVGWDMDPTSRLRTFLRWRRWPSWVFADATHALSGLQTLAKRSVRQSWSGRVREPGLAALRLAGLLPSYTPYPQALAHWLEQHRPSLVVSANWMGQFGVSAERLVERAFKYGSPWVEDPELGDPLADALDAWVRKILGIHLDLLHACGARLCLLHDRAVVFAEAPFSLAPGEPNWVRQLRSQHTLPLTDALAGLDPMARFPAVKNWERWIWPVTPQQQHVIEALSINASNCTLSPHAASIP